MTGPSGIREHMEVIGADGVHVGTIDRVEGDRIKLTKRDSGSGSHEGHHHYLPKGLVAEVEGDTVRLSATGANALMFQQEDEGSDRLIDRSPNPSAVARDRERRPNYQSQTHSRSSMNWDKNWTGMAIAAAGVATAAGAALFARSRKSQDEIDLRLETDENVRLISSEKVDGTPVYGRDGEKLGKIESFMVDKYTGRVSYAVLSFGGTLGFGESLFPLPWSLLTYDEDQDGYVLNLTKEQLKKAPSFKRSETPEFDGDYRRGIARSYRLILV